MIYDQYYPTRKNPAWIVMVAMMIPDTDYIVRVILDYLLSTRSPIQHGDFHNILVLCLSTFVVGYLISLWKTIHITDAISCVFIGFLAHLAEDAFVYKISYPFLAPFSTNVWHTAILAATSDVHYLGVNIGSTNVYIVGFMLIAVAVMIRTRVQGYGWLDKWNVPAHFFRQIKNATLPGNLWMSVLRAFTIIGLFTPLNDEEQR
jgi:hypothetical protein